MLDGNHIALAKYTAYVEDPWLGRGGDASDNLIDRQVAVR